MPMKSMNDLFLEELKDIYHAESQVTRSLPRMAKAASSPELRQAFEQHLEMTHGQIKRLEQVFQDLGKAPRGKVCKGMQGLVEEGKEVMEEEGAEAVKDAALISAAQRVEHYEIAAYGSLRTYAQMLGMNKAARLLQETLDEEGETDKLLTRLAESNINQQAMAGDGNEMKSRTSGRGR